MTHELPFSGPYEETDDNQNTTDNEGWFFIGISHLDHLTILISLINVGLRSLVGVEWEHGADAILLRGRIRIRFGALAILNRAYTPLSSTGSHR